MLESEVTREVCENSYMYDKYLLEVWDIRPKQHDSISTWYRVEQRQKGGWKYFVLFIMFYIDLGVIKKIENRNIIHGNSKRMKHKSIINKCHIFRNVKSVFRDIITYKTVIRVTIPYKYTLNCPCFRLMSFYSR